MDNYKAPIRDLQFNIFELFGYDRHYQDLPGYGDVNAEIINAILNEFDKFCSNILSPLNAVGDQEGCQWHDGEVTTPGGFREAGRPPPPRGREPRGTGILLPDVFVCCFVLFCVVLY